MSAIDAILDYWFGDSDDDAVVAKRQKQLWWAKNADTDATMRERFEPDVIAAGAGELDHWRSCPSGWLALIILCDQFTRNIYRDSPRAFALRHRAIIERFGRFPHRNAILGRESSAAEIAFLREPGSSF